MSSASFHGRYLSLTAEIEDRFPVADWRSGDVDLWPLARMDLYLDMYWQQAGACPPRSWPAPLRIASKLSRPAVNLWKSRRDLKHFLRKPAPADAIFLGDGVSLDFTDGAWVDRFAEPVVEALERQGRTTFLMQSGGLARLPWRRPTFSANLVEARGWLAGFTINSQLDIPSHGDVLEFLCRNDVQPQSLAREKLERRARFVAAAASAFERILDIVSPRIAFVVTYYAHLGHAFVLACRRRSLLSVDLQHDPQDGAHEAYFWHRPPAAGYRTLPAVFWNWTEKDACCIRQWTDNLSRPWHRSICGGHTQLAPFANDAELRTQAWDKVYRAVAGDAFEREILIALQPIAGYRDIWRELASAIKKAPQNWRWWIRRHPASTNAQHAEYAPLLALCGPNVRIEEASRFPLPALLRHMDIVLSLSSGAAYEGAMFDVPALFLSEDARASFPHLIRAGKAKIVGVACVTDEIARWKPPSCKQRTLTSPPIDETLHRLDEMAREYGAFAANRFSDQSATAKAL